MLWIFAAGVGRLQGDLLELPTTPPDPVQLARLSRTLNLLRSATPENRRPVRIIFFGQSITQQAWWLDVRQRLMAAYPHAELEVLNQAISGFAAEYLSQVVDTYVAAYRPDLVILDDYGYEKDMDELVARLATRTHADILLQTDHIHLLSDVNEPTDPALLTSPTTWAQRNYVVLPRLAERYGACLADIRDRWRDYLNQHKLAPAALLADNIHLNADGNALLAALVWRYLVPEAEIRAADPDNEARVRTLVVGRDLPWQYGTLSLHFFGENVEVVTDAAGPPVNVEIDGRKPSELPELYRHSATSPTHAYNSWPAVLEVTSAVPLIPENWELTITRTGAMLPDFDFRVDGSVTGFDGEGTGLTDFRSNSGRVLFRKESLALPLAAGWTRIPIPVGFKVKWSSAFVGTNSFLPVAPPSPGRQPTTSLVRGLPTGWHRLDLHSEGYAGGGIKLIRVFSLTRAVAAVSATNPPPLRLNLQPVPSGEGMDLVWPTNFTGMWPVGRFQFDGTAPLQPVTGVLRNDAGMFRLRLEKSGTSGLFQLRPGSPPPSVEFLRAAPPPASGK